MKSSLSAQFKFLSALLLMSAALGTVQAQTLTYNFNSGASDFASTFTANNPGGGITTHSSTSGISGSGSFSTNGVTNQTVIFNTPLSNYAGASFTTSFFFQTRSTVSTGDLVGFGFFNSTTQLFDAGNLIGYKINQTNSSSLSASTWYQLVATTTNTGSTFTTSLSLQSFGASGTTATGGLINIGASNTTGGTLLNTGTIYVGIYGGAGIQGLGGSTDYMTPAIDNFSVSAIPEPSTYAAIAGAGALGLAIWHRRRRAAVPSVVAATASSCSTPS